MHDFLQPVIEWSIQILEQFGMIGLFIFSFTESLFHPIPVDPILLALSAIGTWSTLDLFFWVTFGSVLGALTAHYFGSKLGKPIFIKIFSEEKFEKGKTFMEKWGTWSVIFVAITPLPFKVIAWMAGILHMNTLTFIIASIIGRATRFILVLWIFELIKNI